MEKLTFKIVTDDYKYASKLLPEYEIIEGDIKSDFMHLYFSQYSILSNSSFDFSSNVFSRFLAVSCE